MAIGATMHTFEVDLSLIDRAVYESFTVRVARHPSETEAYMMTRLLAYCMEYEEGIAFAEGGVSSTEEPAVLVRDLTGRITAWIEIGAPDAARLHFGSKLADRTAVYTHRDPAKLLASWSGKTIHRASEIPLRSFDPGFIDSATTAIERRNTMSVSVTEGQLYLTLGDLHLETPVHETHVA
ncbi:YaeQ family protein [Gulosibacter molinativorax]|uniref:YaeQ family protein n=1 Tax=Gulosibacter molinativorax TaxID=256821 RepID=A0ABT7C7Q3_9MICO|nr:YaeQ family protein [Gulosibacter molinativorax]MDJ1371209.1 hypothetical protein [Gulosibacter molinativorax]